MTKLTFLGTGTSQGVPMISCDCWVCTSPDSKDKRLRSSVMIEQNGVRLIVDAGPDFRTQMLTYDVKRIDAIMLTHGHKDHVGGLDDVRAFNYTMQQAVKIYCTKPTQQLVRKDFDYAFADEKYPGVPEMELETIDTLPFCVGGVEVVPIQGMHYRMPVVGFRVDKVAYLTDFNYISDEEIEKLRGVEVLVINALRREKHISHYTLDEALYISYLVGAERTYFTHLSHQMGRYAQIEPELPQGAHFAYDGLVVETKE